MSSIKRDVKKKLLPRPEGEKILVSRSSPLSIVPSMRSKVSLLCLLFLSRLDLLADDDASRVLKLGKRKLVLNGNHGSIGGSWPIAISGSPRGHSV
jgi:hypothetical protein